MSIDLSLHQIEVIEAPLEHKMFLAGPAGTGKTTSGVAAHGTSLGIRRACRTGAGHCPPADSGRAL